MPQRPHTEPTTASGRDFDRDAAERVLRRAVHLAEHDDAADGDDGISEQALIEAAEELGVDVAVVRRAAVEERLGLLIEVHRRGDVLVGPGALTVHRIVEGGPEDVLDLVDAWLRRTGGLRRQRRDGTSASYARRSDPAARARRAVRSVTGQEDVRRVRRLLVSCSRVDDDRTMLVLTADLELERALTIAAGSGVAGAGSTIAIVEALTWTPWIWLGVPASIAAGTGVLVARAHGVPDIEASMQGVLDHVATGVPPSSVLGEVTGKVLRGVSRSRRTT